jgi:hypothetical protein
MSFSEEENIEWEEGSSSGDDNAFLVLSSIRSKPKAKDSENDSQKKKRKRNEKELASPDKKKKVEKKNAAKTSTDSEGISQTEWEHENTSLATVKQEEDEGYPTDLLGTRGAGRKRSRKRHQTNNNTNDPSNAENDASNSTKPAKKQHAPPSSTQSVPATIQSVACPVGSVQACRLVAVDLAKGLQVALLDEDGNERTVLKQETIESSQQNSAKANKNRKKYRQSVVLTGFATLCDLADDLDSTPVARMS